MLVRIGQRLAEQLAVHADFAREQVGGLRETQPRIAQSRVDLVAEHVFEFAQRAVFRAAQQDVELAISQQLSDFSQTQIGVNSSPTLNKRELSTTLVTKFGEVVVLGGLKSEHHIDSKRWLPFFRSSFPLSASSDERSTELVILLQLQPVTPEKGA